MISQEALNNFHTLVSISGEPCVCDNDDVSFCRACAAREGLERITMEISELVAELKNNYEN
jgi:hypothetical protein